MTFFTENCIITGEKATCFWGHVILHNVMGPVHVLAGFKDEQTVDLALMGDRGYMGEWKKEDGLVLRENLYTSDHRSAGFKEHKMIFEDKTHGS